MVLFFFVFSANAQNVVNYKGTVLDINTQLPLELATVYFTNVKDSTVIEIATTDKNGEFKINTKKYEKPVFLKVNYLGYQTFVEEQNALIESKDFGKIYLLQNVNALKDVVITSEAPPVRIKKDTLEYNAASFKVRPDSNVEVLLKQLPGFEVDSDGKITVNGKEVSQFLVNGKPFFDREGTMALKNLPAEIINKVQVSDFKTKKEELSKQESTSDYSSINLTIDEKKNKGYFGKFLAGYGTDDYYESSFIVNYFKGKQKISVLGSSNNINATGFSMDEVFDNMSGGRNSGGRAVANTRGITQSNLFGINYSDEWSKKLEASGSYDFKNLVTKNDSESNQTSFLPTRTIFTNANSNTRNEDTNNKANFELEYKINPTTRLVVTPNVSQSRSNSESTSSSSTKNENEDGTLINDSAGTSYRASENQSISNTINFNKAFARKAQNISLVFTNNNSKSDSNNLNISRTNFYGDNPSVDERDQNTVNDNSYNAYSADLEYTQPITDSLRIRIGSDFDWNSEKNDVKTFNADSFENYTVLSDSLSNYATSRRNSITPKMGINFEKNKFTVNLTTSSSIVDYDNYSLYLNKETELNRKYVLPAARAQIRYRLDRSKFFTLRYDYANSLPTPTQLMPVVNLSNPLNTVTGNPDLRPSESSSASLNYRNFDFRTRSGYTLFMRGDYSNNEVVSIAVIDTVGKRRTTYENVSGIYSASAGGNWNKTIKKEAHVFRFGLGINGNYSFRKGFTNAVIYNAKALGISPRVYLSYDYGELLTVSPSYSFSYNETNYENSSRAATSNVVHRFNIQATNYWPKNWIFGNDFGYTYNSNLSGNFKKDFYLWNTSLSYGVLNKTLYFKVKVYDVLNQNLSATRTISATSIRDEENTVLRRYAMFSVSYKLGSFGGKERRGRGGEDRPNRGGGRENMEMD